MTSDARDTREEVSTGGALDELLRVEQRIEGEVAAARAEAERRVEAARETARRLASGADGPGDEELLALRASIEAEAESTIAGLEQDARAEVESYRRVDAEGLRRLARRVVESILAEDPQT